jgi:GAF domain-containing protein
MNLSVVDYVGVAVENAQLLEEVKRKSQELEVLVKINRDIAALLDREALHANIAEQARRLLKMDGANFRLLNGEYLDLVGFSDTKNVNFRPRTRVGESILGRVVKENRVLTVRNMLNDPTIIEEHREAIREAGYRTFLGVPVTIGDRAVGALALRSKEEREFSPQEISLIIKTVAHALESYERNAL